MCNRPMVFLKENIFGKVPGHYKSQVVGIDDNLDFQKFSTTKV